MTIKQTIIVDNISKYFKKKILDNVSLQINTGEIIGIFGPNGAGKTTCFNIIAGIIKTDTGKLLLNNVDITNLRMFIRAKLGIGYLPQESSIFNELSVSDNIKLIAEIYIKNSYTLNNKVNELLNEFSITHIKDLMGINLSGGERRRVEIARSLATNPKFLMVDEPLAGIDPLSINDIKNIIIKLKNQNIGILLTDHNIRDMLDIIDRAYIMYDGKILIHGTKDTIINNNIVRKVYLGNNFTM